MVQKAYLRSGLTMPEVLGASAVILTVATIATLSVKDTVQASSQAAMQRELQQLNTALNNYDAVGGVIPGTADTNVQDAIDALKGGVGLTGSGGFTPLVDDPSLAVSLDGEAYNLDYNPEGGFSYVPASGKGDAVTDGGGVGAIPGTFPFDVTDPGKVAEALTHFTGLDRSDPARQTYIEGFNAARGLNVLSEEQQKDTTDKLFSAGVYDIGGEVWAQPNPSFNVDALPESVWEAVARASYPVANGWEADYADQLAEAAGGWKNLVKNMYSAPSSRGQFHTAGRVLPRVYNVENIPMSPGDWAAATQQLNAAGWEGYFVLDSLAFQGKLDATPKTWARNIDWRTISNTEGMNLSRADMSGLDLNGFVPNGASLWNVNLAGAKGLTPQALAQSTSLAHTNMMGTGVTMEDLRLALVAAGKVPGSYGTVTESGWILKDAVRHVGDGGVVIGYSDSWRTDPNGPDTRELRTEEGNQQFNLDTIKFDP